MTEELILAADVGATKAILGLFAARDTGVPVEVRQVPSQDYDSLEALVRDVYPGGAPAEVGCFGIPGPVLDGTSSVTNLGWTVHEADLVRTLGLRQAILINDVAAMAYGIPLVAPERMLTLNVGCARPSSNAALLAVGTGLGEAILAWTGREHVPMSGEGGHADLAPRNPLEIELLQYLQRSAEHVGWERVLSGAGLVQLYSFLRDRGHAPERPEVVRGMRERDPGSVISAAAFAGECALCSATLDLFVTLCGAEAGNLALKSLATAGVYLAGGVAAKIGPWFREGGFMRAFTSKDRMHDLLSAIPVHVVLDEMVGLLGAARFARMRRQQAARREA